MTSWYQRNKERARANAARWTAANPDKVAAIKQRFKERHPDRPSAYSKTWQANNASRVKGAHAAYAVQHPKRAAAKRAVYCAIARGDLVAMPCWVCGAEVTEAHHADYDRPLDVVWLCRRHHKQLHTQPKGHKSMTANIQLFDQPVQLPSFLKTNETAKALAAQIDGGLAGRNINRISLRNGKFRFNKAGTQVGVSPNPTLDVVIIAANPNVGRIFYADAFDPDEAGTKPDCYSLDGKAPAADAEDPQHTSCALCPQNVAGSAKNGKGKACAYKKRVVVVAPDAIAGDAYAVDVAAMGLFGEDEPAQKLFNLKSYIEALKANGLIVPSVVTRLSFDDESSVPKLFFTPVRVVTAQEWAQIEERVSKEDVKAMLDDVPNATEAGKPVAKDAPALAAPTSAPAPAPAPAAAPAEAPRRRGRKPAAETPPAQAPAPTATPPAAGGFGFAAAPAAPAAPAAAPAAQPAGGFTVDLDGFDD